MQDGGTGDDEERGEAGEGGPHGDRRRGPRLVLSQEPGMTVERLAVTVGVTGSGAVRLLDRLEAEGLVERRRGADPRARYAYLTAAGRRMARKAFEARNRELDRILAGLNPGDRETFSRLTDILLAAAVDDPASAERACRFCDLGDCPDGTCPLEDVHGRA